MNRLRQRHWSLPLLCGFLLMAAPASHAETTGPRPPAPDLTGDDLRIREVFTSHLPRTQRAGGWRFSVHPHLGDFDTRNYMRVTTGGRYGLSSQWEVSAEVEGYFSHGLGDSPFFKRAGFSAAQVGTKYDLGHRLIPRWDTAIGFDFETPVSRPPADLTDGMQHIHPYLVSSRRLPAHPGIRVFWGAAVDLVHHTDRPRELQKNQLDDDATELSAGVVWDRRSLHYTFEAVWASTHLLGQMHDDCLTLRPGVIWEVPWFRGRNASRMILIGAALRTSFGPDGSDFGGGAKVRISFAPNKRDRIPISPQPKR